MCEFLRNLIDATSTPTLSLPKDAGEFVQMMSHHALVCLDNLKRLPQWASDGLCGAVTGSGFSKRQLYSDDSDVIYHFKRTFILNGISIPGSSPDLLDRCIIIELDRLPEEKRCELGQLVEAYNAAHPQIFGGMLDALSRAMSLKDSIELYRKPRMADWAVWGCAIAEAMGIGHETFLDAYYANINFQHEEVVNSEPVCHTLTYFMAEKEYWEGTPSDLYGALEMIAQDDLKVDKSSRWPKAAHALSRYLKSYSHNLAQVGIEIIAERGKSRRLKLRKRQGGGYPTIPSYASLRHEANDVAQLEMTDSMTLPGLDAKTVTKSVISNKLEPLPNNGNDDGDAISGTLPLYDSQTGELLEEAPF